jgi:hypothetical protein
MSMKLKVASNDGRWRRNNIPIRENGEWRMENGEWGMGNGEWGMGRPSHSPFFNQ